MSRRWRVYYGLTFVVAVTYFVLLSIEPASCPSNWHDRDRPADCDRWAGWASLFFLGSVLLAPVAVVSLVVRGARAARRSGPFAWLLFVSATGGALTAALYGWREGLFMFCALILMCGLVAGITVIRDHPSSAPPRFRLAVVALAVLLVLTLLPWVGDTLATVAVWGGAVVAAAVVYRVRTLLPWN